MKNSILLEKSYNFALRMVKLFQFLAAEKKEFVLSKQVLRSGTSIGANMKKQIKRNQRRIYSQTLHCEQRGI